MTTDIHDDECDFLDSDENEDADESVLVERLRSTKPASRLRLDDLLEDRRLKKELSALDVEHYYSDDLFDA